MAIKRKIKPTPPQEPKAPERLPVSRRQVLCSDTGSTDRGLLIKQLHALPEDAVLYIRNNGHCSGCTGDCYDDTSSEFAAEWRELQTDEEYAVSMKYHQQAMKRYQKEHKAYLEKLEKWEEWYQDNKEALEEEDQKAQEAEVARLEQLAKQTQKQLEAAQKRLAKKKNIS